MVDMNDLEEKLKEVIRTDGKLDPDKLANATVWLAVFLTQSVPAETFEVRRKKWRREEKRMRSSCGQEQKRKPLRLRRRHLLKIRRYCS